VLRFLGRLSHFGVLAPLACLGLWVTWSDRRSLWVVYAMGTVYGLSVLAFYVVARYRLPLVPFLIVFAAAAVVRSRMFLVTRTRASAIARRRCCVGVTVRCSVPVASADAMRPRAEPGRCCREDGRR
jgi:hypothetical protein